MPFSLLWYDLETFGRHPQWDRIAQFAAIRTDDKFQEIGEPVVAYCRLSPDYVPHPDAVVLTGITPQEANEKGVSERDFSSILYEQMIEPATCSVGYNSIRFDDEFVRALLYRNFYDPYRREYENGNSRWDIIDLMRMFHDLRPEGIEWVRDERGVPTFKLELLAAANGIEHDHAHDALSDVRATIGIARLAKERNQRLFKYYFSLRKKEEVRRRLNLQQMEPVLHTSGMFSSPAGCTSIVIPLSVSPANPNEIITYDLRVDPSDWLDADAETIRRRVFTRASELGAEGRIALKGIHLNRSPAVAPINTVDDTRLQALEIDLDACMRHAEMIKARPDLIQRIRTVYERRPGRSYRDPDLQIYSGDFFPDEDREEFEEIRTAHPEALKEDPPSLHDPRAPEMLWRYLARNHPEVLGEDESRKWKSFCASRILTPEPEGAIDIGTFLRDVENRLSRVDTPARDKVILKALLDYGRSLEREILE
jgi:exodeoxyribonuclease-1